MKFLDRAEIEAALRRLGELVAERGESFEIVVVGGAAMVLGFNAREATKDVDFAPLSVPNVSELRSMAAQVADEFEWEADWLNDAAKGFLHGLQIEDVMLDAPGIRVWRPSTAQLLAMKLSAWRDEVDIADARLLLDHLGASAVKDAESAVMPFVVPGYELKVRYALEDLWRFTHPSE